MHSIAVQAPSRPATSEPFDQTFVSIRERRDLHPNAKLLYGLLRSVEQINAKHDDRPAWEPSYADLAESIGCSIRSIIRYVAELVRAGLIACRRRGQGLTNLFAVIRHAVARSDKSTGQQVPGRHLPTKGRKKGKEEGIVTSSRHCLACATTHAGGPCPLQVQRDALYALIRGGLSMNEALERVVQGR